MVLLIIHGTSYNISGVRRVSISGVRRVSISGVRRVSILTLVL